MAQVNARTRVALDNILVATDFSPASDGALDYALALARQYGSTLHLIHVIRTESSPLVPPEAVSVALEQARKYAEEEMAGLLISGRLRGVPHEVLLTPGEVWTVLAKAIEERRIDLLVLGTRGRTGVRKLLLGSVAEQLFRLASCPVLTVGPRAPHATPAEAELRHIVFATDFGPASERAAAYALSLAQERQARLIMVHAVEDLGVMAPAEATRVRQVITERLLEVVPPEAELWCEPELVVESGPVAEAILRVAKEQQADLIVLGVRRPGAFPGHLPPATAYRVVCHAPCPVLTVRG